MDIHLERDFADASLLRLLQLHKEHCEAETPIESCHRLDVDGLRADDLTFWVAWENTIASGAIATGMIGLKEINATHGEVKSMNVLKQARGLGLADRLFEIMKSEAQVRGYQRLSLETGASPNFRAAIGFYKRHGFDTSDPFEGYQADPNSIFMTLTLSAESA